MRKNLINKINTISKNVENLAAVHTHTHTHTHCLLVNKNNNKLDYKTNLNILNKDRNMLILKSNICLSLVAFKEKNWNDIKEVRDGP